MKWTEALRPGEQDELNRAEAMRATARAVYNATVRKLKSRCEQRIRAQKLKDETECPNPKEPP